MRRLTLLLIPAALFAAQNRYARLGEFQGKVEVQLQPADAWMAAERNLPLPESTWLRTSAESRLEVELDEGSALRLGANAQAGLSDFTRLSTGQRVTVVALDRGVAYFTGESEGKDVMTLVVPGAQVTVGRGTRLRLEAADHWSQISVIEGTVRFSSPAAEMDLREGQTTRVEPANPSRFFLYREVLPMDTDRWSEERDKALMSATSAMHVLQRYGLADLDAAGEWIQAGQLGAVWKPKSQDAWTPYQNGRWRWYDTMGYTWVSDDSWGWLPYHYGRWTRQEDLGWVWVPSQSPVFKPGEVYFLRGAKFVGWGPLAPGQQWNGVDVPLQFANTNMTYATFQPESRIVDPAGFTGRPKDPLAGTAFMAAMPSPAFVASRLDAVRPVLVARVPVKPEAEGATLQTVVTPPPVVVVEPAPPPDIFISDPPQNPPIAPPVMVPVIEPPQIILVQAPDHPDYSRRPPTFPGSTTTHGQTNGTSGTTPGTPVPAKRAGGSTIPTSRHDSSPVKTPPSSTPTTTPSTSGTVHPIPGVTRDKKFRDGEAELVSQVEKDIRGNNFKQAVDDLRSWTDHFPRTEFSDERRLYYMQAFNGVNQPARVMDMGAELLAKSAMELADQRQVMTVLFLASFNVSRIQQPTRAQIATGATAAQKLLAVLPDFFAPSARPPATSETEWRKARKDMENVANTALAFASGRPAL